MSEFEIIPLPQNGRGYLIDQLLYRKRGENGNIINLKCRESGCSATAKIDNGLAYVLRNTHSHEAPNVRNLKFKAAIKDVAGTPAARRQSLNSIIDQVRQDALSQANGPAERREIAADLPSRSASISAAHRSRVQHLPKNPQNLSEIDAIFIYQNITLPDETTGQDRSFLLHDSGATDPNRMLIFGNKTTVERLAMAETLHLDGTFWVTPGLFKQLVTIHTFIYGQMFPVLYILLNGKSEQTYIRMLDGITEILDRFHIQLTYLSSIVSDFESGLIAAIRVRFPNVWHRGCYFHFSQSIYRTVVRLGYKQDYQDEAQFREGIRHFLALGHVPSAHKFQYYQYVYAKFATDPRLVRFAEEYFYPTWFRHFSVTIWDWFNICVRTNNHVEGWHSGLKSYFEQPHLQFYRFVGVLLDEEKKVAEKLRDRINGAQPPRANPTYAQLNQRILNLHSEFYIRLPLDIVAPLANCCPKPLNIPDA